MKDKNLAYLNDMLFNQLERLSRAELDGETLQDELQRTDAIVDVSKTIISSADLMLRAMVAKDEKLGSYVKLPKLLQANE